MANSDSWVLVAVTPNERYLFTNGPLIPLDGAGVIVSGDEVGRIAVAQSALMMGRWDKPTPADRVRAVNAINRVRIPEVDPLL